MAVTPLCISIIVLLSCVPFSVEQVLANSPNDVLIKTINSAAGMELIPHGTKFQLTEFHGTSTESSVSFPDGGHGHVSGAVYTGKFDATSSANGPQATISICIFFLFLNILIRQ